MGYELCSNCRGWLWNENAISVDPPGPYNALPPRGHGSFEWRGTNDDGLGARFQGPCHSTAFLVTTDLAPFGVDRGGCRPDELLHQRCVPWRVDVEYPVRIVALETRAVLGPVPGRPRITDVHERDRYVAWHSSEAVCH